MIDVLIIGSGGAGLSAAIEAKKNSLNVVVLSKTHPTYSQTVQAQGGINAVLYENNDSINEHLEDTYKASNKLSNKKSIEYLCKNAKNTINWLDKMGVSFSKNEDSTFCQRKFGGTKKLRTCYSSDYTGLKILHTLYDQCIKDDIKFINEHQLLNLIVTDSECYGITALDIQNGKVIELLAKSVIICSGGYAGIYNTNTTNSFSNTGDGLVSAYKAGVKLSNLEFVQFHPTTLEESNILISESARGEGGYLLDKEFNRFVDELESRDKVAREIASRINKNEKVYLDLRHLGEDKIDKAMPQEKKLALEFSNIDIAKELLPINPAAHYTMGGIKSDHTCQTNIDNLFVCGEVAEASIHGANRLGGNSLLEIITLGREAGINASKKAKQTKVSNTINEQINKDIDDINEIFTYSNEINFYDKRTQLGEILFKNVGLFRNETDLLQTKQVINDLKKDIKKMGIGDKTKIQNTNLVEFIEFRNMLELSELIVQAAINRKESRGSHYRSDYKDTNKFYDKATVMIKINKKNIHSFEDVI